MQPTPDDFAEWRQLPVTEWVLSCIADYAEKQKQKWSDMAWDGDLNPILLCEAKTRADAYLALKDSDYSDWKAIDDSED